MKKAIVTITFFVLGFYSLALAEQPYKASEFPPQEVLKKIIPTKMEDKGEYLGKIEIKESTYLLYYRFPKGRTESVSLIMLDTNYWIYDGKNILMK